jgi:hypothetical protein
VQVQKRDGGGVRAHSEVVGDVIERRRYGGDDTVDGDASGRRRRRRKRAGRMESGDVDEGRSELGFWGALMASKEERRRVASIHEHYTTDLDCRH